MMFERFTRDDRILLAFAMQEAADLGHRRLGNDHLLLGMLCNARSPLFTVLAEQGLTLMGAREASRVYHDAHASDAADVEGESAADRYEDDREALRSIGIDLDKVREAVRDRFGDDLADGWAERADRRRGHGRGGPDCAARGHERPGHEHVGHEWRDHDRRGRARERFGPGGRGSGFGRGGPGGPSGEGFAADHVGFGPGFGPFADGPFEPGRGRRGPRGRGLRPRFAPETRQALEAAIRIAREREDHRLRAEYLLLGIIDTADPAALAVITSATTLDQVRAAVLATLPQTPADA